VCDYPLCPPCRTITHVHLWCPLLQPPAVSYLDHIHLDSLIHSYSPGQIITHLHLWFTVLLPPVLSLSDHNTSLLSVAYRFTHLLCSNHCYPLTSTITPPMSGACTPPLCSDHLYPPSRTIPPPPPGLTIECNLCLVYTSKLLHCAKTTCTLLVRLQLSGAYRFTAL
jgi:hypothetical protein